MDLPVLDAHARLRLVDAAEAARSEYPGPIGEVIAEYLGSWNAFGYLIGNDALVSRLADQILREASSSARARRSWWRPPWAR